MSQMTREKNPMSVQPYAHGHREGLEFEPPDAITFPRLRILSETKWELYQGPARKIMCGKEEHTGIFICLAPHTPSAEAIGSPMRFLHMAYREPGTYVREYVRTTGRIISCNYAESLRFLCKKFVTWTLKNEIQGGNNKQKKGAKCPQLYPKRQCPS